MKITEAAILIEPGIQNKIPNATWADLGCGSGTFTKALASLLMEHSKIYAVDKVDQPMKSPNENKVEIEFIRLDFINEALPFVNLDGILMANALHYVKEKDVLIKKLTKHLKPAGQFIIIEYETENSNQWVPYPINFKKLQKAFSVAGFSEVIKISERKSIYQAGKMYAAVAMRG
jgi:ubiquinone/menaquinone biosynthesis C-methylase UbiE